MFRIRWDCADLLNISAGRISLGDDAGTPWLTAARN